MKMKELKRLLLLLSVLTLFVIGKAKATWSIVVIDSKTKAIGIAGASCTYSVYGIGAIAPGKGALVVQAMSNTKARNKGLQMILANTGPDEILKAIRDPEFDPEQQQYGIVCLYAAEQPRTYTGSETTSEKGALTSLGVSVQGNTLSNKEMLGKILDAVLQARKASLSIQDVLMLALEAGAEYGGDKRCGDRKALSAFLTIAKPDDDPAKPFLNLVFNQSNENINAVKGLRGMFEHWKRAQHMKMN
jgi:uncharacterized Ntn-hydrolase superfamily protein